MAVSQLIGASIKRREDPELVTGSGNFVDDMAQTAFAYLYVVRSTQAHARIEAIETSRAKEADGVLAVWTDKAPVPDSQPPLPVTPSFVPKKKYTNHSPIASDRVRYVGEPVALVL